LITSFYNQLAAVPSLHAGFALAVVATGNQFVFDIAAGGVATGLGYLIGHHRRVRASEGSGWSGGRHSRPPPTEESFRAPPGRISSVLSYRPMAATVRASVRSARWPACCSPLASRASSSAGSVSSSW
jgi:hypothetical protein